MHLSSEFPGLPMRKVAGNKNNKQEAYFANDKRNGKQSAFSQRKVKDN